MEKRKISFLEYHCGFWTKIKEKELRNKKEIIKRVWNLEEIIIFLFLRLESSHKTKIIRMMTLPEARSIPGAGLIAN
jgi:hypothetical protein